MFEGVYSPPASYTARQLIRAIDRAPRWHAGSPVYRVLVWLARIAPSLMQARLTAAARTQLKLRTAAHVARLMSAG